VEVHSKLKFKKHRQSQQRVLCEVGTVQVTWIDSLLLTRIPQFSACNIVPTLRVICVLLLQDGQIGEAWKSSRKLNFFVEIREHLTDKVLPCIFLVLIWLIHSKIMKCRIQNFVKRI
jgi:hypothetical protein